MKQRKLFAILTLVVFMMTLLPMAAFAAVNPYHTALFVDQNKTQVNANGTDKITFTVYLMDGSGPDLAGDLFIASNRGLTTDTIEAKFGTGAVATAGKVYKITAPAGENKVEFTVKSSVVGTAKIALGNMDTAGELYDFVNGDGNAATVGHISTKEVKFTSAGAARIEITGTGTPAANGVDNVELVATVWDNATGGNPVAGQDVTFVVDKTAAKLSAYTGTTNALGQVKTKVTSTASGAVKVTASAGSYSDDSTITFGVGGAYDIKLLSGDNQKVATGNKPSDIKFNVTDINGNKISNPVANTAVASADAKFKTKPSESGLADADITVVDTADNYAKLAFANNIDKEGTYVVTVSIANGKTMEVTFTAKKQGTITGATISYKQNSLAHTKTSDAGGPTIKLVDAEGYGVSEAAGNFTWSTSNPDLATVAATGVVTAGSNTDKSGTVVITAVHNSRHYVVTNEFAIGGGTAGVEVTVPSGVQVGEAATLGLTLVDANGNLRPYDNAVSASVTLEIIVSGKPAGAIVETSVGATSTYQENLTRTGKQNVTVKSDTAGEIYLVVKVYDGTNYILKPVTLNFGAAKADVPGANKVTLVIGQTVAVVDGDAALLDVVPFIQDGRTFVPVRFIAQALGAEVKYDAATQVVTAVRGDDVVVLTIGSNVMTVNGEAQVTDVAPFIVDGRTVLPFRALAEAFGSEVAWDAATQTVVFEK